jgi:TRAP-type C4-dicarboxylate transport system permease large subunit
MSDYQKLHQAADRAGVDAARTAGYTMASGSASVIFPPGSSYAGWLVEQGKS